MSDIGDAIQKLADTMNLSAAEVERDLDQLRKAFEPRDLNGELGRASAKLQRLSTATDERRVVPRVYRGLECLAPFDSGPVLGAWFGEAARFGPVARPFGPEFKRWLSQPRPLGSAGSAGSGRDVAPVVGLVRAGGQGAGRTGDL